MDNFKAIYGILKTLDRYKGDEDFDTNSVSADTLNIPYKDWEQIIIELQRNGYIDGVTFSQTMGDKFPHVAEPICPRITMKGMEYLANNTMMKKVANTLKGIKDIIPGL